MGRSLFCTIFSIYIFLKTFNTSVCKHSVPSSFAKSQCYEASLICLNQWWCGKILCTKMHNTFCILYFWLLQQVPHLIPPFIIIFSLFFCDQCLVCIYFGIGHEIDSELEIFTSCSKESPHPARLTLSGKIQAVLQGVLWSLLCCSTSAGGSQWDLFSIDVLLACSVLFWVWKVWSAHFCQVLLMHSFLIGTTAPIKAILSLHTNIQTW